MSYIDHKFRLDDADYAMIVGSFGAQAVLIFSAPTAPLSQPWNCIFGNAIGSFVGVTAYKVFHLVLDRFDDLNFVAAAFAVSVTIVLMMLTKSLHPPAGATALIAVLGSDRVHDLGYMYVLFPAIFGSCILVLSGFFLNNLSSQAVRTYPTIWIPFEVSFPFVDALPHDPSPVSQRDCHETVSEIGEKEGSVEISTMV